MNQAHLDHKCEQTYSIITHIVNMYNYIIDQFLFFFLYVHDPEFWENLSFSQWSVDNAEYTLDNSVQYSNISFVVAITTL